MWKVVTGDGIDSSPALVGDTLLIGSQDFFVYALDANSGAVRWKYETGLGMAAAPAVSGDAVVIGSKDGHLYTLEVATENYVGKYAPERRLPARPCLEIPQYICNRGDCRRSPRPTEKPYGARAWAWAYRMRRSLPEEHLSGEPRR